MIHADCLGYLPSIEANAAEVQLEIVKLPPVRHNNNLLALEDHDDDDDMTFEESPPTRELV